MEKPNLTPSLPEAAIRHAQNFGNKMAEVIRMLQRDEPVDAILAYLEAPPLESEIPSEDKTIGISFMPEMKLSHVPTVQAVPAGGYVTNQSLLAVEVVGQDPTSGNVTVEVPNEDGSGTRYETMSQALFSQLFQQLPPTIVGTPAA